MNQADELRIFTAREQDIGFTVRRLLPQIGARSVGPFVFLDHMGPATFPAGSTRNDVRPHPHIGLGTITWLFSGAMMHRDSLGSVQRIEPGALNWMCAGSGITHSERVPEDIRDAASPVEGLQMWIALPVAEQECPAAFVHHEAASLPQWHTPDSHWTQLIGQWGTQRSPASIPGAPFCACGTLQAGARVTLPADVPELAAYVVSGRLEIGTHTLEEACLAMNPRSAATEIVALADTRVLLLGGAPLDAPRVMWWNFVSTSRERIARAAADWEAGHFPPIPGENERIPAPPFNLA